MSTYRKNIHRFPLSLSVKLIDPEEHIGQLVGVESACFPKAMQDHRRDFEEYLDDKYASGLMLYRDGKPIGYIMGSHISEDNSEDLLASNPFIQKEQDSIFYVDSVAILGEERSVIAFDFLLHETFALLKSIGYHSLAAHVRKKTGFSRLMRNRFGGRVLKAYENWNEFDEPFDYLLIDFSKIPTLSTPVDYFFQTLRFIRRKAKGIVIP